MKHREPRNQGYKYCYDRGSGKKRKSNKDGSRKRSERSNEKQAYSHICKRMKILELTLMIIILCLQQQQCQEQQK